VLLFKIPITPFALDAGSDGAASYVHHPAVLLAGCHALWRGKATIRIVVFSGALDAGRVYVVYYPGQDAATGALPPLMRYSKLLDISSQKEMEFEIDWHCQNTFLTAPSVIGNSATTSYTSISLDTSSNGAVVLYVDSPLVSNQTTTSIGVSAFIKWSDLDLAAPSRSYFASVVCTSGADVPRLDEPRNRCYAAADGGLHLRSVLTQYAPEAIIQLQKAAATTTYGVAGVWLPSTKMAGYSLSGGAYLWVHQDVWTVCVRSFLVYRGGTARRFFMGPTNGPEVYSHIVLGTTGVSQCTVELNAANTLGAISADSHGSTPSSVAWYLGQNGQDFLGDAVFPSGPGQFVGAAQAYRSTNPWTATGAVPTQVGSSTTLQEVMAFAVGYSGAGTSSVDLTASLDSWFRFQDDVVLSGFMGMPIMAAHSPAAPP